MHHDPSHMFTNCYCLAMNCNSLKVLCHLFWEGTYRNRLGCLCSLGGGKEGGGAFPPQRGREIMPNENPYEKSIFYVKD